MMRLNIFIKYDDFENPEMMNYVFLTGRFPGLKDSISKNYKGVLRPKDLSVGRRLFIKKDSKNLKNDQKTINLETKMLI